MPETKATHTPGPWTFSRYSSEFRGSDGKGGLFNYTSRNDLEIIHNRLLILAAPLLLAACEDALVVLQTAYPEGRGVVARALEAAIAKARGDAS